MNNFIQKWHRVIFYGIWFFLAVAQASATELIGDEAYYWVYSKFLSWGYFDHPPMVALLIKWGYAVLHNELGVRLLFALMSTGTLLITEKLTDRRQPFLFYTIVAGIGVLQLGGYLAVPDTPLLFFTALFFYTYRKFLLKINFSNALILGLVTALLFYSKYHGFLIVFFAILSNIRLLGRWQSWLAGMIALLLFAPHLYWQWQHDWISFKFHVSDYRVRAFQLNFLGNYFLGQLLMAGPLVGLILMPAWFLYKPVNKTEKALKFTIAGMYIFFFISAFRTDVQANWLMPVLVPLIVLSHQYLVLRPSWQKTLKWLSLVSLVLIMAGRIYIVVDIGPGNAVKRKFLHTRQWATEIKKRTGDTPVIFYNSYQQPSQYWFYTGLPSHAVNLPGSKRKNNYDFWPTGDSLKGKPVYIADRIYREEFTDSVHTVKGWVWFRYEKSYKGK